MTALQVVLWFCVVGTGGFLSVVWIRRAPLRRLLRDLRKQHPDDAAAIVIIAGERPGLPSHGVTLESATSIAVYAVGSSQPLAELPLEDAHVRRNQRTTSIFMSEWDRPALELTRLRLSLF